MAGVNEQPRIQACRDCQFYFKKWGSESCALMLVGCFMERKHGTLCGPMGKQWRRKIGLVERVMNLFRGRNDS